MSRVVNVFLLPQHFDPHELRGGVAVVFDVLRASTTILAALRSGAKCVMPFGDVPGAKGAASGFRSGEAILGGERGGMRIEGFDLDNSPSSYAAERVSGKTVVFTTTNGTAALMRATSADRILIGSLVNRRTLAKLLLNEQRPVHLICAGTDGRITAEDLLAAGAIVAELEEKLGPISSRDDVATIARAWWQAESVSPDRLFDALSRSQGGRNLVELGYEADIRFAARVDAIDLVAEYFPATGRIEPVR